MHTTLKVAVALAALLSKSAFAQAPMSPASFPPSVNTVNTPIQTAPTGFTAYPVTTTAGTAIPASSTRNRLTYQVQGTGYACVSWATAAVTITGSGNTAVCGGNGAFLVTTGSTSTFVGQITPTTVLTAIGATGSALTITGDAQ